MFATDSAQPMSLDIRRRTLMAQGPCRRASCRVDSYDTQGSCSCRYSPAVVMSTAVDLSAVVSPLRRRGWDARILSTNEEG